MRSAPSSDSSQHERWKLALGTETRRDEQGHPRDNDVGCEAPLTQLAAITPSATQLVSTTPVGPMSFVLRFAKAVPRSLMSASATMTETFEKGGGGGRDDDLDAACTGTETKVGDPTSRDQDADLVRYAPIGARRDA